MAVDLYLSTCVAADGPIPGPYSMLSFAMVAAATFDGTTVTRLEPATFHRELQPISADFVPADLANTGLDRASLARTGTAPALALAENVAWITEQAARHNARPVLAGRALGHSWLFTRWYQLRFAGRSPFGDTAHLDITTLYADRARRPISAIDPEALTEHVLGVRRNPLHVLDDALDQAAVLYALLK